jgi:hypothetical protein
MTNIAPPQTDTDVTWRDRCMRSIELSALAVASALDLLDGAHARGLRLLYIYILAAHHVRRASFASNI